MQNQLKTFPRGKREYSTPTLTNFGAMAALTAGGAGSVMEAANNGNTNGCMAPMFQGIPC